MIQFTKEFSKQLKREQERQARIEKCLEYLQVCYVPAMTRSGYQAYAAVNSTSTTGRRYLVFIDESGDIPVAERCNCAATVRCIHMDSVDLYYQRIAALFSHDEQEETAEPEQPAGIEVNALLLKNRQLYRSGQWNENGELIPVSEVMPNEYDILGPTKKVSHAAYGCCGHLVKFEDAGELCGACRCK